MSNNHTNNLAAGQSSAVLRQQCNPVQVVLHLHRPEGPGQGGRGPDGWRLDPERSEVMGNSGSI